MRTLRLLLLCAVLCDCSLPPPDRRRCNAPTHLPGIRCLAGIRRYTYNKETNECEYFRYGGCRPSPNNFRSMKECEDTCVRR